MILCLLTMMALLAGCETTKGAAKDMENTGQNIQEGVQDLQNN